MTQSENVSFYIKKILDSTNTAGVETAINRVITTGRAASRDKNAMTEHQRAVVALANITNGDLFGDPAGISSAVLENHDQ